MKATGIVRQIDPMGRIVIPKELRKSLEIDDGDSMEIFTKEDTIILRKYQPSCIFCGNAEDITTFKGRNICPGCLHELTSWNR